LKELELKLEFASDDDERKKRVYQRIMRGLAFFPGT
jgi:hypothetical protein